MYIVSSIRLQQSQYSMSNSKCMNHLYLHLHLFMHSIPFHLYSIYPIVNMNINIDACISWILAFTSSRVPSSRSFIKRVHFKSENRSSGITPQRNNNTIIIIIIIIILILILILIRTNILLLRNGVPYVAARKVRQRYAAAICS